MTKRGYLFLTLFMLTISTAALLIFPARTVGLISLFVSALAWWGFVTWYTYKANWWSTPYGRNVAGVAIGLALALTLFGMGVTFGQWPGHEIAYTVIFQFLTVMAIQRTYHMDKAQRDSRNLPH